MNKYRSEEISQLMASLAKAQGQYLELIPNEDTPGGKFANLNGILKAVRNALSENGLTFFQHIELLDEGSGASLLWTQLGHSSGQYISSCSRVVPGGTFREVFNSIEAYKRLSALLILGIAPVGKDPLLYDDNGASQAEKIHLKNVRSHRMQPKSHVPEAITSDEYDDLMWELEDHPDILKGILKFYEISTVADLPKTEFHTAKAKIRQIKKTHEDYVKTN